jgi:L-Ala-D/L-Glu epimerase
MSQHTQTGALDVSVTIEKWPFSHPLTITGYTFMDCEYGVVELRAGDLVGRGEYFGVYYLNDDVAHGKAQIEDVADRLRAGITREELLDVLPAGGARNGVDCALWDLEAKQLGRPAWQIAGLQPPRPLRTTHTLGAEEPERMAERARGYVKARAIKLKLTGTPEDAERVRAVRAARPDVWMAVDGNQGFDRASLAALMPALVAADVQLVEQPFPRGHDADLDGFESPIELAADESAQDIGDLPNLVGRYDVVNIKLDKCGGLTRGLAMHAEARRLGMKTMVGCMGGTSLAMAPGFLLGQLCEIVDLDGPIFLAEDRTQPVVYDDNGCIFSAETVWGGAHSS